jgi:hypothetical protein
MVLMSGPGRLEFTGYRDDGAPLNREAPFYGPADGASRAGPAVEM